MRLKQLLLLCFVPLAVQAEQLLTLQACVEKALESNYGIKITKNQEAIDRNNVTYGQFMPTLSANGSQRDSRTDSKRRDTSGKETAFNGSPTGNIGAGVNLNWRIFDGFSMFVSHDQMKQFLAVGELKSQMAVENLISEVSIGYYNVLVQRELLEVALRSLDISTERFQIAKEKYRIGTISGLEYRQTKIDLNADSSKYVRQQEVLKGVYIQLNTLMNVPLEQSDYVQDSIGLLPLLNKQDIQRMMLKSNTSLQIARRGMKISEQDMKIARSAFFPTVDFGSGYSFSRNNTPASITTFTQSDGFFWGFTVNVPIFNRLDTRRKVKNAKIEMANSELGYREVELKLQGDLAQLFNTYETNHLMVGFEAQNAKVAEETLQAALERYRIGNLSGIEFREFQRSYLEAVTRRLSATFHAKVSEISILLLSGQL